MQGDIRILVGKSYPLSIFFFRFHILPLLLCFLIHSKKIYVFVRASDMHYMYLCRLPKMLMNKTQKKRAHKSQVISQTSFLQLKLSRIMRRFRIKAVRTKKGFCFWYKRLVNWCLIFVNTNPRFFFLSPGCVNSLCKEIVITIGLGLLHRDYSGAFFIDRCSFTQIAVS